MYVYVHIILDVYIYMYVQTVYVHMYLYVYIYIYIQTVRLGSSMSDVVAVICRQILKHQLYSHLLWKMHQRAEYWEFLVDYHNRWRDWHLKIRRNPFISVLFNFCMFPDHDKVFPMEGLASGDPSKFINYTGQTFSKVNIHPWKWHRLLNLRTISNDIWRSVEIHHRYIGKFSRNPAQRWIFYVQRL